MKNNNRCVLLLSLALLAACSTHVTNTSAPVAFPAAAPPGPPKFVLVEDFAALPASVQLDNSPGALAQGYAAGASSSEAQAEDVQNVQAAITETLVQAVQAMGLPARAADPGTVPGPDELLVTGQITTINEGSRAKRLVVGFGAGKSAVQGSASVLRGVAGGPPATLQTFDLNADSGHLPGLGIGIAANAGTALTAASAAGHTSGEIQRSPVAQQAASIAKQLAASLKTYFTSQGWITTP